jgi:guanylate kinase
MIFMNRGLVVISGFSGAGKSTLIERFVSEYPAYRAIRSFTDRKRRSEEENYYFISPSAFDQMIQDQEFLEHTEYAGHRYGTSFMEIKAVQKKGRIPVLDLNTDGFEQLLRSEDIREDRLVSLFITVQSPSVLKERLQKRAAETEEEIHNRLQAGLEEAKHMNNYDAFIINDDEDRAYALMKNVIFEFSAGDPFDAVSFTASLRKLLEGEKEDENINN